MLDMSSQRLDITSNAPRHPDSRRGLEIEMNVSTASALIAAALETGKIDRDTAVAAQAAIRTKRYGSRMTSDRIAAVLAHRFGIVEG